MNAPVIGYLTGQTCGDACWHAREDVCHCSCGGRNHGCLRTADGEQPVRTSRIAGEMFKLAAIGLYPDMYAQARKLATYDRWNPGAPMYPAIVKTASKAQIAKMPELAAYRDAASYVQTPALLWLAESAA